MGFLGSSSNHFAALAARGFVSEIRLRICLQTSYTRPPGRPTPGRPSKLRHHIAFSGGSGLLTRFPSTTPFGLALGADSPCSDERRAGNLGLAASGLFTRFNVTHVSIRTSDISSSLLRTPSQTYRTLPYHARFSLASAASVNGLAPLHLPRRKTRPVSYYAFFEGWLLLSQLPGCLGLSTSFST